MSNFTNLPKKRARACSTCPCPKKMKPSADGDSPRFLRDSIKLALELCVKFPKLRGKCQRCQVFDENILKCPVCSHKECPGCISLYCASKLPICTLCCTHVPSVIRCQDITDDLDAINLKISPNGNYTFRPEAKIECSLAACPDCLQKSLIPRRSVKCPSCARIFPLSMFKKFFPPSEPIWTMSFQPEWHPSLNKAAWATQPRVVCCNKLTENAADRTEVVAGNTSKCKECNSSYCSLCFAKWEDKHMCKSVFQVGTKDCQLRNCPKCLALISKIDGCNAMYCEACLYSFLWDSGDALTEFSEDTISKNLNQYLPKIYRNLVLERARLNYALMCRPLSCFIQYTQTLALFTAELGEILANVKELLPDLTKNFVFRDELISSPLYIINKKVFEVFMDYWIAKMVDVQCAYFKYKELGQQLFPDIIKDSYLKSLSLDDFTFFWKNFIMDTLEAKGLFKLPEGRIVI